jgi:hypothetical protein
MLNFAYQFAGMKSILFSLFFSSLISLTASAQNTPAKKEAFSIAAVTVPHKQTGKVNYQLALSPEDFQNKQYIFYTDSNARVAHITINGKDIRLTGGPNAEHIMAYSGEDYTVTLHNETATDGNALDNKGNLTAVTTLVIYDKMGRAVVRKVTGNQVK